MLVQNIGKTSPKGHNYAPQRFSPQRTGGGRPATMGGRSDDNQHSLRMSQGYKTH